MHILTKETIPNPPKHQQNNSKWQKRKHEEDNLLMQFFTLGSSKIEVSESYFVNIVITQNDHPTYAWYVLGSIYVFFTFSPYLGIGCAGGGGGGSPKGLLM